TYKSCNTRAARANKFAPTSRATLVQPVRINSRLQVLQHPFPVLDPDHHPRARIETEMIGLAHIHRAVRNLESFGSLQSFAQRTAEFARSRLRSLERLRHGVRDFKTGVPGIGAECGHAACSLRGFV